MRAVWRTALIAFCSLAIVVILATGTFAYLSWPHCDRERTVLAKGPAGQSIISEFEACRGLGTKLSQKIELVSTASGRKTLLGFEPNGGVGRCNGKFIPLTSDPSAIWTDPKHVRIVVPVLIAVIEKHDTMNGINITYEFGTVIGQECH